MQAAAAMGVRQPGGFRPGLRRRGSIKNIVLHPAKPPRTRD
jgi:hypothetical protein